MYLVCSLSSEEEIKHFNLQMFRIMRTFQFRIIDDNSFYKNITLKDVLIQ